MLVSIGPIKDHSTDQSIVLRTDKSAFCPRASSCNASLWPRVGAEYSLTHGWPCGWEKIREKSPFLVSIGGMVVGTWRDPPPGSGCLAFGRLRCSDGLKQTFSEDVFLQICGLAGFDQS